MKGHRRDPLLASEHQTDSHQMIVNGMGEVVYRQLVVAALPLMRDSDSEPSHHSTPGYSSIFAASVPLQPAVRECKTTSRHGRPARDRARMYDKSGCAWTARMVPIVKSHRPRL